MVGGWIMSVYAVVITLQITAQNLEFELCYLLFLVYYDYTYLYIAIEPRHIFVGKGPFAFVGTGSVWKSYDGAKIPW